MEHLRSWSEQTEGMLMLLKQYVEVDRCKEWMSFHVIANALLRISNILKHSLWYEASCTTTVNIRTGKLACFDLGDSSSKKDHGEKIILELQKIVSNVFFCSLC